MKKKTKKDKKKENIPKERETDRRGKTSSITKIQNIMQKEAEQKLKYNSLCLETENVEHEVCDFTGNNCSHWNSNKSFK